MNPIEATNSWRILPLEIDRGLVDLQSNISLKADIKSVLICRPNHRLGNLLLLTPLLQEITEMFPDCKIDLFVKGDLAPVLFKNYENIRTIIQLPKRPLQHMFKYVQSWISIRKHQYDLVINVDKGSSSGRLSLSFANSKHKISGDVIDNIRWKFKDYDHHAKFPIYNLRNYLTALGFANQDKLMPSLNLKLNPLEIADGKRLLGRLVNNQRKTICLFTYATGDKCYSEIWWENFYDRLQAEFPQFNIIEVLPVQNVSKLSFKIPTFYSKDIREIGSLIANTDVFIGADSGIMHLASAVQTPTVGLFSVTDQNLYAPYNESSVAVNTSNGDFDKCIQAIHYILHYKFISLPDLRILS